jgi:repressor LexA
VDSIGERIKYLRKKNNISQQELADATGLQRGNLSHYEKNKTKPSADTLVEISSFFNVSLDWLITGKDWSQKTEETPFDIFSELSSDEKKDIENYAKYLIWKRRLEVETTKSNIKIEVYEYLPLIGKAAAGRPLLINELVEGYVPVEVTKSGQYDNCYLIQVQGESMIDANIQNGDLVIVRPQPAVENGEMALVRVGDEATIKYFYKQGDKITLKPANDNFPNMSYSVHDNIAIIGKVLKTVPKTALERLKTEMPEEYKKKVMKRNNLIY